MKRARTSLDRDDLLRAIAPGWAVLLAAVPLALFWFSREYTHDDFYLAYLAWIRSTLLVAGSDYIVPNFTPLAEFSAPIFRAFRESFVPLDLLRVAMLAVAVALIALTFEIARRLSGSVAWGLASAAVVVWHPQVVLRIADIRTDQVAMTLLLFAVALLISDRTWPFVIGACVGLAGVLSPKLVVAIPFVALPVLMIRRPAIAGPLLRFAGGVAVAPLAYFTIRIWQDGWETFRAVFVSIASAAGTPGPGSRLTLLREIASSVPILAALAVTGAVFMALSDPSGSRKGRAYAVLVAAFIAAFVALNPFLYIYNAVILVPLVAPLLAGLRRPFLRASWSVAETAALALISVLALTGGLGAMRVAIERNSAHQRNVLQWVWENTAAEDHVFDWQGMHFGRPGVPHWWIHTGMVPLYQSGRSYRVRDEWQAASVRLVLNNYRIGWLESADARFLRFNFVPLAPCALVPGRVVTAAELTAGVRVNLFAGGLYETAPAGSRVLIDGKRSDRRVRLEAGSHLLQVAPDEKAPTTFGIRYLGQRRRIPPCGAEPLLPGFNLLSPRQ